MDRTNLMKEKCIWFQLCGHEHILTLPEFAVVLEVDDKHFDYKDYWTRVGKPTLTNHKEVLMEEPLMRIVHKVIVGSLVHRVVSRERCQKREAVLVMINSFRESCGKRKARIGDDDYFTSAMPDFRGSSSEYAVGDELAPEGEKNVKCGRIGCNTARFAVEANKGEEIASAKRSKEVADLFIISGIASDTFSFAT
ncbi:hypothetical protein Tco_0651197 [Tanacetum coccineum]